MRGSTRWRRDGCATAVGVRQGGEEGRRRQGGGGDGGHGGRTRERQSGASEGGSHAHLIRQRSIITTHSKPSQEKAGIAHQGLRAAVASCHAPLPRRAIGSIRVMTSAGTFAHLFPAGICIALRTVRSKSAIARSKLFYRLRQQSAIGETCTGGPHKRRSSVEQLVRNSSSTSSIRLRRTYMRWRARAHTRATWAAAATSGRVGQQTSVSTMFT